MSTPPCTVVFALFDGVTQLDFTGPWEVFARLPGARVILASREGGQIQAQYGLVFSGVVRLADIPGCDLICVPGGPGTSAAMLDQDFIGQIRRLAARARLVTSVCTGSLVLGAAGLLQGRRAATHWSSIDMLAAFGAQPVADRWVRDGNLITGGGVTAGIDFALAVAAEMAGEDHARMIQLGLEYAPAPPFDAGDPVSAGAAIRDAYLAMAEPWMAERRAATATAVSRLRTAAEPE